MVSKTFEWRILTVLRVFVVLLLALVLSGCSDNDNDNDVTGDILTPQPANPIVEEVTVLGGGPESGFIFDGAIDLRDQNYKPGTAFYSGLAYDAAEVGYRETEYFISGTAVSYVPTEELG